MTNYYRINVSHNGKYLFATEDGSGGSGLTWEEEAKKVFKLFQEKFPKFEGYEINVTYWEGRGYHMNWEEEV